MRRVVSTHHKTGAGSDVDATRNMADRNMTALLTLTWVPSTTTVDWASTIPLRLSLM